MVSAVTLAALVRAPHSFDNVPSAARGVWLCRRKRPVRMPRSGGETMKRLLAIAACVVVAGVGGAFAQTFPSRPVTIVVPFAAGGPTDVLARVLGQRMSTTLGQSVVIENVTGAGGSIGVGRVVRSPADGYTLSIGQLGTHALNGAIYPLPYDLLTDLEPIALLASNPQIIVTKKTMPAKDLKELIAWLKANQDKVIVGTAGAGTPAHVSGVYLQNQLGSKFQFVPYRGAGPAMQDLIAGNIDLYFDQASNSLPHVRNGSIKAYAVTSKTRMPSAPDVPTAGEAGLPGLTFRYGMAFGRRRARRRTSSRASMLP